MNSYYLLPKPSRRVLSALLLALAALFASTSLSAGEDTRDRTVSITNGEWPPYLSEKLPHFGIVSRIVTESFARRDMTAEFSFYPWSRALAQARAGHYDGTAVWVYSEDRAEDFYLSDPVIRSQYVFFYRKDKNFSWESAKDLTEYRIGGTRDYHYSDWFEEADADGIIQVEWERSDEINLRKLIHGRIDLFPMDPVVAEKMILRLYPLDEDFALTYHPKPLHTMSLRLLLTRSNPDNEQAMDAFNAGLREVRAEGLVERYMNEYLIERDNRLVMPVTPME